MKRIPILLCVLAISSAAYSQRLASPKVGDYVVPDDLHIKIVKAEDSRDAGPVIAMFTNVNIAVRYRAALAAGRIGDDKAIAGLIDLLSDPSTDVQAMAAFAIGEVESSKGSEAIIKLLDGKATPDAVMARAIEAAGKIAAANQRDAKFKDLGDAVLDVLDDELRKGDKAYRPTILLGITAILRARPSGSDEVAAKFLKSNDPRIRSDAANTLTRLRAKNANTILRSMLVTDTDGVARANAARALGAADDKASLQVLLTAAMTDKDQRVRVSSIRSVGLLKDVGAATKLIERGKALLALHKASRYRVPSEKSELLEIISALGQLLPNSEHDQAVMLINEFRMEDGFSSPESDIALARIAPKAYVAARFPNDFGYRSRYLASAYAQGMQVIAASKDADLKQDAALKITEYIAGMASGVKPSYQREMLKALPDLQRANAAFKPDNLGETLRALLKNDDVNIRATAADLLSDLPQSKENIDALNFAFSRSMIIDKITDDATLGIMGALFKLNKKESVGSLLTALNSPNYLVRRRAFQMLADKDLQKDFPGIPTSIEVARAKHKDLVLPYTPAFGSRLGQVLNNDVDYRRALSRRDGAVKAQLTTDKGTFTIDLFPEEAPMTVDNFVQLARKGYFNGLEVHRVVPNFVMQDGDPNGDGTGGPGHTIRCEINMLMFERGTVGMALSGKDTGGSQWFVDHSPQPHLDGGYTVFGKVNEAGMAVVDNIVRGDIIRTVRIIETKKK